MYDNHEYKVLRTVQNYSLIQKGNNFYIDNGINDVSEYFDEFEAYHLETCEYDEFLQECKDLFE